MCTSLLSAAVVPLRYYAESPPGFDGFPFLYVSTLFSLMMIGLLSLEWTWRLGWQFLERPSPLRHPVSAVRLILIFLLLGTLIRVLPNLVYMTLWADLSPHERRWWMQTDALLDTISFFPFSISWLIGYLGGPMIIHQLLRHPIPLHLWPTGRQMFRPLKIGMGVLVISLAVVFLQ